MSSQFNTVSRYINFSFEQPQQNSTLHVHWHWHLKTCNVSTNSLQTWFLIILPWAIQLPRPFRSSWSPTEQSLTESYSVSCVNRREHASPLQNQLHRLPIKERILYKILLLVYKFLHNCAPVYLIDLLNNFVPPKNSNIRSVQDLSDSLTHCTQHLHQLWRFCILQRCTTMLECPTSPYQKSKDSAGLQNLTQDSYLPSYDLIMRVNGV